MGRADGFDKTGHHLVALRVAEWHGWVFANAGGDAPPFEEHAGNLDGLIRNYGCGELVVGARHDYEISANWKILAENYHECYHCSSGLRPLLRQRLLGRHGPPGLARLRVRPARRLLPRLPTRAPLPPARTPSTSSSRWWPTDTWKVGLRVLRAGSGAVIGRVSNPPLQGPSDNERSRFSPGA
jgi:hypothetical protein